jgi:hypothetical protein
MARLAIIAAVSLFLFCKVVVMPENDTERTGIRELNLRPQAAGPLIWGQKISAEDCAVVRQVAVEILADANDMMAGMAWESMRTFSPKQKNLAGSSGVGPIQIMRDTAKITPEIYRYCTAKFPQEKIRHWSLDEQIDHVMTDIIPNMTFKEYMYHITLPYFRPYRGRVGNLPDLYCSILYPAAIGQPMNFKFFIKDTNNPIRMKQYIQNKGLDANKDGIITKAEACAPVLREYEEGKKYSR